MQAEIETIQSCLLRGCHPVQTFGRIQIPAEQNLYLMPFSPHKRFQGQIHSVEQVFKIVSGHQAFNAVKFQDGRTTAILVNQNLPVFDFLLMVGWYPVHRFQITKIRNLRLQFRQYMQQDVFVFVHLLSFPKPVSTTAAYLAVVCVRIHYGNAARVLL